MHVLCVHMCLSSIVMLLQKRTAIDQEQREQTRQEATVKVSELEEKNKVSVFIMPPQQANAFIPTCVQYVLTSIHMCAYIPAVHVCTYITYDLVGHTYTTKFCIAQILLRCLTIVVQTKEVL